MNKELIIRSNSSAVDFALLKDGKLIELNKEVDDNKFSVGDIYVAKIKKPISGLNAAFVGVGHEKDGFLHYHDLGPNLPSLLKFFKNINSGRNKDYSLNNFRFEKEIPKDGSIQDYLKSQQQILVQIVKEPISTKGPRVSSELSLAGRFMVLIPFSDRISISQKIESNAEKNRLKKLVKSIRPKGFGVIIRTVAQNQKVRELDADLQQLLGRWKNLCERFGKVDHYPTKILSEINRSSSILRDIFDNDFTGIHVDDPEMLVEIKDYLKTIAPDKVSIVKYFKNKNTPIFDHFGIERQIKTSFGQTVSMQKGAYLVIEHTEALHVIDVNSGNRSNKARSQEQTAFEVNMIAASEIARQFRLRAMSGAVLIDGPRMAIPKGKKFRKALQDALANDPRQIDFLGMTRGGLLELQIAHGEMALDAVMQDQPAQDALAGLRLVMARPAFQPVTLAVSQAMASWLEGAGRPALDQLDRQLQLVVWSDDTQNQAAHIIG